MTPFSKQELTIVFLAPLGHPAHTDCAFCMTEQPGALNTIFQLRRLQAETNFFESDQTDPSFSDLLFACTHRLHQKICKFQYR